MRRRYFRREDGLFIMEMPKNPRFQDLTGRKFGRLTVVAFVGSPKRISFWACRCDCGEKVRVRGTDLKDGRTRSCGCLQIQVVTEMHTVHGCSVGGKVTKEYEAWRGAKGRCFNKKDTHFEYYGGRGIEMCERWRNSFPNFLFDMGQCPPNFTLDRIDNNKGYEPGNCRWADRRTQSQNRRNVRRIAFAGKIQDGASWEREFGWAQGIIRGRLARRWSIHRIMTTPPRRTTSSNSPPSRIPDAGLP